MKAKDEAQQKQKIQTKTSEESREQSERATQVKEETLLIQLTN